MKTWTPRYKDIAHLSPTEKFCAYVHGEQVLNAIVCVGVLASVGVGVLALCLPWERLRAWSCLCLLLLSALITLCVYCVNHVAWNTCEPGIVSEEWHSADALPALLAFARLPRSSDYDRHARLRSWAYADLTAALPTLQTVTHLTVEERWQLYGLLTLCSQPDLQAALLDVVERLGEVGALEAVRAIGQRTTFSVNQKKVRERAWQCRVVLEERLQEKIIAQTLLRAANAPEGDARNLLRAVAMDPANIRAEAPQELLRANAQQ